MPARRVLVTGVANFWGAALAEVLWADPDVEEVIGLDVRPPSGALGRTRFVEADLRSPTLTQALQGVDVDVVVHNDINQFPGPDRNARQLHDINVIGTLQLLAACGQMPSLRAVVVRGSAAIYGSEAGAPQFFTEELAGAGVRGAPPARTRFQRDIAELERLCETFARRRRDVTCTVLRLQPVVGPTLDTPITQLMRAPVIPTFLGFDPRLQLLHEEDSVAALAAAVRHPVRGAVNVAGEGTVALSWAIARMGRLPLPIPGPLFGPVVGAAGRAGLPPLSEDTERYLRYGRGVDVRRLVEEVGFRPRHTTRGCVDALARALGREPGAQERPAETAAA